jgi:hypothetical protein
VAFQFDRKVIVTVGERTGTRIQITNLRIQFQVEKTTEKNPNRATLVIYNLSPNSRSNLEEKTDLFLTIEAGYGDETQIIFSGDVDKIENKKSPTEWITTIESGDGVLDLQNTEFNKSYKKGTKVTTVIQDLLSSFKNLDNKSLPQDIVDDAKEMVTGGSFSGSSSEILKKVLGDGVDFSVQNNEITLTKAFQPITNEIFIITPTSGLINSPSITEEKTKDGKIRKGVNFTTLLNPKLSPKQEIRIQNTQEIASGDYVISKVSHQGDSQQGTFYSVIETLER